jgi:hypothetical protein
MGHLRDRPLRPRRGESVRRGGTGRPFLAGRPDVLDIPGFYDGDGIYRIRFMPDALGQWRYSTRSNRPELDGHTGTMTCVPPGPGNHGPVRVHDRYHWAYADGTPYYLLGTTIYNWVHRDEPLQERTLATLRAHRFNKVRFCIPPKSYAYRHPEPAFHPWPRQGGNAFDRTRFDPRFFRNFERRLGDLKQMGIVAELILFHIYDRWGHRAMSPEQDEAYLRYVIARLAAFRNVWWTLANEYELFHNVNITKDWDHIGRMLQRLDPYDRPRSNHNHTHWYDASKPWVTHANLQYGRPDDHPPDTLLQPDHQGPRAVRQAGRHGRVSLRGRSTAIMSMVMVRPFHADGVHHGLGGRRGTIRVEHVRPRPVDPAGGVVVGHVVRGLDQVAHVAAGLVQDLLQLLEDVLRLRLAAAGTRAYWPEM